MDLVRQDARELSRRLEKHDNLYRQIFNLRRELVPQYEALLARKRTRLAELAQLEIQQRELKREGLVARMARSVKEMVHGGLSQEEVLNRRRLDLVSALNAVAGELQRTYKRVRELVEREERLLSEVYGEKPLLPRLAPWLFGIGAALAAATYGLDWMNAFWSSMAVAASGAACFWYNGMRHNPERIFLEEEDAWRRIRVRHDDYRGRLLEQLENVGLLLKEFREPSVDVLVEAATDDLDYQKSVTSVLLELARRDDHVSPAELETIESILGNELGLAGRSLEQLRQWVRDRAADTEPTDLPLVLARFKDPAGARLLVRLLYRVAFADSRFYGREEALILQAARNASLPLETLQSLRAEERELALARGLRLPDEPRLTPEQPIPADIAFVEEHPEERGRERRRERD